MNTPESSTPAELPATASPSPQDLASAASTGFLTVSRDPLLQGRLAKCLCQSAFVPQLFRQDQGAVMLVMDMAQRLNCNPFMLMQNIYNVQGNICMSGKFCCSLLQQHPSYSRIRYEYANPQNWEEGVRVVGVRHDGELDEGPWVTLKLVKAEGWLDKRGSKWLSMPDLMARYRAAAFFCRIFCPDALMGMKTSEEVLDFATKPTQAPPQRRVFRQYQPPQDKPIPADAPEEVVTLDEPEPPAADTPDLFPMEDAPEPTPAYHD